MINHLKARCTDRNHPALGFLTILTVLLGVLHPTVSDAALRIMPLGDSITYGYNGFNGSPPGGYRKQLALNLAAAGVSYEFVGNSTLNPAPGIDPDHNGYLGIRTDQALSALPGWLAANPDVVLVHLGTNDMIQHVPVATAINNLGSILQQVTVNSPNRKVYVATIIPIIDTRNGHTPAEWSVIIAVYNAQVRALVQQYANLGRKVFLTEMNASLVYTDPNPTNNFFQPGDGTHPGQVGYNQMGNFWFNSITNGVTPLPVTGTQLLTNGSFESDFTGWTTNGNVMVQASGAYLATDGTRLAAFNAGNSTPNGSINRTFSTTPGTSYSVTFDAGVLAYNTSEQRMLVTVTGSSPLLSQVVAVSGAGNGGTRWVRQTFSFVADGGTATLTFRDQSSFTNSLDLLLDNVRITGGGTITNSAPVAVADSGSTPKNTALVVPANGVLANDTDAQSNPLTAALNSVPMNGSVSLNSNGGYTYTPNPNFTGADAFSYHANDGSASSNIVSVNITVTSGTVGPTALTNGSFESGFTGWTISGNQEIKSTAPYFATHGTKMVAFNGGNLPPNASVSQTFATIPGARYTLTFDAGVLAYNTNSQTFQLTVTGTASLLNRTVSVIGSGNGTTRWLPQSFSFVADRATTTLTFRDISSSTNSLDLLLDNVVVNPSPSALLVADTPRAPIGTATVSGRSGALTIGMAGSRAGTYVLERSENLSKWERIQETELTAPGPVEFQDSSTAPSIFYRIGLNPEPASH